MSLPHTLNASVSGVRVSAELVETFMQVRATAPAALESLARALRSQADRCARDLVHTPPDSFQAAQGRAQALDALAVLATAPDALYAQLHARKS